MSRASAFGFALTLAALSVSVIAHADDSALPLARVSPSPQKQATIVVDDDIDDTNAIAAFFVGAGVALVPFAIGTTVTTSSTQQSTQNAGVYTLQAGLAVAPFISHAMVGEWGRATLWSILPIGASIGMVSLLQVDPDAVTHTSLEVQRLYYSLVVTSVVVGVVGVADVLRAPIRARERAAKSRSAISVLPMVTPGVYGISVGGQL